jgi:hypothetical protein
MVLVWHETCAFLCHCFFLIFFPLTFNHPIMAKSGSRDNKFASIGTWKIRMSLVKHASVFSAGNTAVQAINLLLKKGVQESNIIFLNLISVRVLFLLHLSIGFAFLFLKKDEFCISSRDRSQTIVL